MNKFKRKIKNVALWLIKKLPVFSDIYYTSGTQTPITLRFWIWQKIIGFNRQVYWPMHHSSLVACWRNIWVGVQTSPGYMPGCYIQGIGRIYIGDYTQIAANVGIISTNHDPYDNKEHPINENIHIGSYCWIGMNSVILPGVTLGDFTVVGAGSVVTHSFEEGYCIVAGNPAKLIKHLDKEKTIRYKSTYEYHGYIPKAKFAEFAKHNLNL